jgi:hypothetical protein
MATLLTGAKFFLNHNKKQNINMIDMKVPDFKEEKKGKKRSLLEEYDREISGKPDSLLKKATKKSASSLANIFQVKQQKEVTPKKESAVVEKKSTPSKSKKNGKKVVLQPQPVAAKAEPVWFVSYKKQESSSLEKEENEHQFFFAFLDEDQKVTHGSSIMLKLKENCTIYGTELKAGSTLYGEVKFAKNRILVHINVSKYLGKTKSVKLCCYDTDFLPGIFCQGVNPVIEAQGKSLLGKAASVSDLKAIKEAGKVVGDVISGLTKTKSFKLFEGREVYICERKKNNHDER